MLTNILQMQYFPQHKQVTIGKSNALELRGVRFHYMGTNAEKLELDYAMTKCKPK